jgi:transcriptional regulator with XRE-family HTH domain
MTFTEKTRQLREERGLPQRKAAEALNIDSATYCKIERGERKAKREQLPILAQYMKADLDELHTLWLADKIIEAIKNEKELAEKALIVTQKYLKK